MTRQNISSGGPWEDVMGYSRAVRLGNIIAVAGTTSALPDGTVFGAGDGYAQAKRCFEIIGRALGEAGATFADVIRTRMYVTNISRSDDFGRAHVEVFGAVKPAATMVQVQRLLHPDMLIEIEVDAVVEK